MRARARGGGGGRARARARVRGRVMGRYLLTLHRVIGSLRHVVRLG